MARRRRSASRNGALEDALALLVQNQAALVAQHTSFLADFRQVDRRFVTIDRRFAAIEQELEQIKAILLRHERILNDLPEAIRQKVGFQAPQ